MSSAHTWFFQTHGWLVQHTRTLLAVIKFVDVAGTITPKLQVWTPAMDGAAGSYADATGAFGGIASVSRTGDGNYAIKLADTYQRLIGLIPTPFVASSTGTPVAPAAPVVTAVSDKTNVTGTGTNAQTITFGTFGATDADTTTLIPKAPAAGEILQLVIVLDATGVKGA